jgi:hypothetical protein
MEITKELKEAIAALVAYNRDEKRHWAECVIAENDIEDEEFEYNPSLCPGHIYHTIRKLENFIK